MDILIIIMRSVVVLIVSAIFLLIIVPFLLQYYAGMIATGYYKAKFDLMRQYKLNNHDKKEQEKK